MASKGRIKTLSNLTLFAKKTFNCMILYQFKKCIITILYIILYLVVPFYFKCIKSKIRHLVIFVFTINCYLVKISHLLSIVEKQQMNIINLILSKIYSIMYNLVKKYLHIMDLRTISSYKDMYFLNLAQALLLDNDARILESQKDLALLDFFIFLNLFLFYIHSLYNMIVDT